MTAIACGVRQVMTCGLGDNTFTMPMGKNSSQAATDPLPGSTLVLTMGDVNGLDGADLTVTSPGANWVMRENIVENGCWSTLWEAANVTGEAGGAVVTISSNETPNIGNGELKELVNMEAVPFDQAATSFGNSAAPLPPSLTPSVPNAMFVTTVTCWDVNNGIATNPADPGWFTSEMIPFTYEAGSSPSYVPPGNGFPAESAWYVAHSGDSSAHTSAFGCASGPWTAITAIYKPITSGQAMPVCRQFFNMATGSDWVLGPTFTPTFLSDPAPGSALVLFWGDQQTALAKVSPLSTVTSPGATWTAPPPGEQINYPATGTGNYSGVGLWIAENVSGATGGAVITATVGGYGLPADAEFWVGEFQNVTTTPFDKGATAFGHLTGSNKIVTAPAPSPTQAGEVFIICCCMHSISGDPTDAGWSNWTAGNPDQAVSYLIAPPTDSATHTDTFTTGATGDYYATASVLLLPMAAVAPIVAGVTPQWGTTAGGTEVLISGSGFSYASQVYFGAAAATSFTVLTDGLISAVAPAHAAGIVDITVVVVATSATSTLDQFTFQARPAGVGFSSGIGFSSTDTFSSKDTFSS